MARLFVYVYIVGPTQLCLNVIQFERSFTVPQIGVYSTKSLFVCGSETKPRL